MVQAVGGQADASSEQMADRQAAQPPYGLAVLGAVLLFLSAGLMSALIFSGLSYTIISIVDSEAVLDLSGLGMETSVSGADLMLGGVGLLAAGLALTLTLGAGALLAGQRAGLPLRPLLITSAAALAALAALGGAGTFLIFNDVDDVASLATLLSSLFALAVLGAYAHGLWRSELSFQLWRVHASWPVLAGGVLGIWLVTLALVAGINYGLSVTNIEFLQPQGTFEDNYGALDGVLPILALAVAAVIVAPLIEEFVFRGVIMRYLGRRMPMAAGVLISTALFVAVHPLVWTNPGVGIVLLVLSLGLSAAYLVLGLRGAMAMHALHNGAGLLYAAFVPEELLEMAGF